RRVLGKAKRYAALWGSRVRRVVVTEARRRDRLRRPGPSGHAVASAADEPVTGFKLPSVRHLVAALGEPWSLDELAEAERDDASVPLVIAGFGAGLGFFGAGLLLPLALILGRSRRLAFRPAARSAREPS